MDSLSCQKKGERLKFVLIILKAKLMNLRIFGYSPKLYRFQNFTSNRTYSFKSILHAFQKSFTKPHPLQEKSFILSDTNFNKFSKTLFFCEEKKMDKKYVPCPIRVRKGTKTWGLLFPLIIKYSQKGK